METQDLYLLQKLERDDSYTVEWNVVYLKMPNIYPSSLTDNIRFWTKIEFYLNNTNFLFNEKLSKLL